MFENIDYKIKTFALVNTVVGISASILFGILCFLLGTFLGVVCGLIIMIGGSLLSWASSFALYGFGRLIELTEKNSETNRQLLDIIAHKNKIDLYSESENTWKCDNCGRINYKHRLIYEVLEDKNSNYFTSYVNNKGIIESGSLNKIEINNVKQIHKVNVPNTNAYSISIILGMIIILIGSYIIAVQLRKKI